MKKADIVRSWGQILKGKYPSLSIEITRECPLRCPGCYAYQTDHLGTLGPLRSLADYKGDELVDGVLALVQTHQPLHVSIVGGEPLVRFRELNTLLPELSKRGIAVQLVTSAVRPIPEEWAKIPELFLVVSIDGLQPDHDKRRAPATYDKILKNIVGHSVKVHCTITHQMTKSENYFSDFLKFWSAREEVSKIWMSIFTPQKGEKAEEILSREERERVLDELVALRPLFPKLFLPNAVVAGYRNPPKTPADCIFAATTLNYTADLKSKISPCQFGGDPDCTNCGCFASAGLNAVGDHRLMGVLSLRTLFNISTRIGKFVERDRDVVRTSRPQASV